MHRVAQRNYGMAIRHCIARTGGSAEVIGHSSSKIFSLSVPERPRHLRCDVVRDGGRIGYCGHVVVKLLHNCCELLVRSTKTVSRLHVSNPPRAHVDACSAVAIFQAPLNKFDKTRSFSEDCRSKGFGLDEQRFSQYSPVKHPTRRGVSDLCPKKSGGKN